MAAGRLDGRLSRVSSTVLSWLLPRRFLVFRYSELATEVILWRSTGHCSEQGPPFFLDTWQYRVLSSVECGVGQQNPRSYLSSRGGRPTITLPHHRLGSLTHSWMQVLIPGGVRGYLQSTRYIGQWPHSCPLPASAHPRQPLSMLAGALVVECRQQAGERPAASQQAHPPWIIDGVCRYELRALAHSCSFKLAPAQAEFRPFLR